MNQNFYTPEEVGHALAGMKSHQRRDILLGIDEILNTLDTTSPAGLQWKAARKFIRASEGNEFAAKPDVPIGAARVMPALDCG